MLLSAILFTLLWQSQPGPQAPVRRLPPKAFRQLPAAIINSLQARRCLIPQAEAVRTPHNVISGSFTGANQKEWAVLCSRRGSSSILVFQANSAKLVAEIAAAKDDDYLQRDHKGEFYFSRAISTVGEKYILEHYKAYGGPEPPPITHHGINDAYLEKASVVRYFHNGKWIELHGAD